MMRIFRRKEAGRSIFTGVQRGSMWVIPSARDVMIACVLYLLNVFDTFATLFLTTTGRAVEMNFLMRALIDYSAGAFVCVKMIVPLIFTTFLLFIDIPRKVNVVLLFLAGVYSSIAMLHILIIWSTRG